jgi:hypothetical protein
MTDHPEVTMKSVKVPSFNGKRDSFQTWWIRFTAYADAYGFLSALSSKPEEYLPETSTCNDTDNSEQTAARNRNKMAVYYLTLAFTTDEAMEFYYKGITDKYPGGLAYLIVKAMHARCNRKMRSAPKGIH